MFENIIVGLDGSENAYKAVRIACELAGQSSGIITLVHVPHAESAAFVVGAVAGYHAAVIKPTLKQAEEAGKRILEDGLEIANDVGCKSVKTHMPHGHAVTEILNHADHIGADLIVTGRRGLSGISSLVMGSTSQSITHNSGCACLSVP
jgi:nucleotide-binding universal stress UspA family protein